MKRIFYTSSHIAKTLAFFTLLLSAAGLKAQQAFLTVQGVLTKADGTAVDDDTYTLTFRLWNDPSSTAMSALKHQEIVNNVETTGGVYTVILGDNGTPLNAGFDEIYYLGVSMNTSTVELLPRPRLTHAPYALGIRGNSNIFPSTGTVTADEVVSPGKVEAKYMRATGGAPSGPFAEQGFSFGTGGDPDGGLFSVGDNNVGLYANGTLALEANNSSVTVPGVLRSNTITPPSGTVTLNGSESITGNSSVSGSINALGRINTRTIGNGGGFSFSTDPNSGLFSIQNNEIALYTHGSQRMLFGANQVTYSANRMVLQNGLEVNDLGTSWNNSHVKFYGLEEGPSGGKNVQWDPGTGSIYWDNSSRKSKRDIVNFEEDFSLILKAQPRIYRRIGSPDSYWEIGYIAEEMDSIGLKKLVTYDLEGKVDGLDYDRIPVYLVEMAKMQHKEIESLKAEIAALKAENAGLKTTNTDLQMLNTGLQQQQAAMQTQIDAIVQRMQRIESAGNSRK
jgi:FtsZ-binding cell division protein ZapB